MTKTKKTKSTKNIGPINKNNKTNADLDSLLDFFSIQQEDLSSLLPELKDKIISIETSSYYKGTLPPPEVVERYEKVLPGSFKTILGITVDIVEYRKEVDRTTLEIEKKFLDEDIKFRKRGQSIAVFLVALGLFVIAFCAYIGETSIGSILDGTTLIALVPHFVAGLQGTRKKKEPSVADKTKED